MPHSIFTIIGSSASDSDDAEKLRSLELEFKTYIPDQIKTKLLEKEDGKSVLHMACKNCGPDLLRALLDACSELIDVTSNVGTNVLFYAFKYNNQPAIDFFLQHPKAQQLIRAVNQNGYTLNAFAAFSGSVKLLKRSMGILRGDQVFHTQAIDFQSSLGEMADIVIADEAQLAMEGGEHVEMIRFFLDSGVPVDWVNKSGSSLMHLAAKHGRVKIIQLLAERNPDLVALQTKNPEAYTPLIVAVKHDQLDAAQTLLEYKADFRPSGFGDTPLHYATGSNYPGMVRLLLEHTKEQPQNKKGWFPIHLAVLQNSALMVNSLMDAKADINTLTKDGWEDTPLHLAVQGGFLSIVEWLVARGAENQRPNKMGHTPMHTAALYGQPKIIKWFSEHKVDVNTPGADFQTEPFQAVKSPLYYASEEGYLGAVQVLLEHKANSIPTAPCESAVHVAAQKGHIRILQCLIKHDKRNLDLITDKGDTPLHYATKTSGNELTASWLINNGASKTIINSMGKNALQIALETRKANMAMLFYDSENFYDWFYIRGLLWSLEDPNQQYKLLIGVLSCGSAVSTTPEKCWESLKSEELSTTSPRFVPVKDRIFATLEENKKQFIHLATHIKDFLILRKSDWSLVAAVEKTVRIFIPVMQTSRAGIKNLDKLPSVVLQKIWAYLAPLPISESESESESESILVAHGNKILGKTPGQLACKILSSMAKISDVKECNPDTKAENPSSGMQVENPSFDTLSYLSSQITFWSRLLKPEVPSPAHTLQTIPANRDRGENGQSDPKYRKIIR